MYCLAIHFLMFSYIHILYEKIKSIFDSIEDIKDLEIDNPEISNSPIKIKDFIKQIIINIQQNTLDEFYYEEIVNQFGELRSSFVCIKLVL